MGMQGNKGRLHGGKMTYNVKIDLRIFIKSGRCGNQDLTLGKYRIEEMQVLNLSSNGVHEIF